MRTLLIAAAVLVMSCSGQCLTSAQCPEGKVCMRVNVAPGDDSTLCRVPCGEKWGECPGAAACSCPDSPSGARCQVIGREDPPNPDGGAWLDAAGQPLGAAFCAIEGDF